VKMSRMIQVFVSVAVAILGAEMKERFRHNQTQL
jgi:hypothetical protein